MRKTERYFSKYPSESSLESLLKAKSYFKKSIEIAKNKYYYTEINQSTSNQKHLYGITNSLLGKSKERVLPDIPDNILCNNFSKYFVDKINILCSTFNNNQHNIHNISIDHSTLINQYLTEFQPPSNNLIQTLLANSNSTSPQDPLPLPLMKIIASSISILLTTIFKNSLTTGIVPPEYKHAIITPILKKHKHDINDLKNYRPISQLPTISKLLERVVTIQLKDFLYSNNLIDNYQSAYRTNHSTETTVIDVLDSIITSLDNNNHTQLLLLDLSAAFDTLDHDILKHRLIEIGIINTALDWMMSFVSNRTFTVKIGKEYSNYNSFDTGVPQGSVLGPLLFIIYIIPLSSVIRQFKHVKYHLYADDILLYTELSKYNSEFDNELSNCANAIYAWLTDNKLSLNTNKSELLNIPSNYSNFPQIFINNNEITPSTSIRYLGVIIDDNVNMNRHVSSMCKKANYELYKIRKIGHYLNKRATTILTNSLVFSSLDYCNSLLIGLPKSTLLPIDRIIRSAVRNIYRQPRHDHSSITLKMKESRILNASDRAEQRILNITHRTLTHNQPTYIRSHLKFVVHNGSLRSNIDTRQLKVTIPKLKRTAKRAYSYIAPTKWNALPLNCRLITNPVAFKIRVKQYLIDRN